MADKVIASWLDNLPSWQPNPVHLLIPTGCALNVGANPSQSCRNRIRCFLQGGSHCHSCGQGSIHLPGYCSGAFRVFILPWPLCRAQQKRVRHILVTNFLHTKGLFVVIRCAEPCCPLGVYQCQGTRTHWRRTNRGPWSFSRQSQDGQFWQPAQRSTVPRLSPAVSEKQQSLYTRVSTQGKNTHGSTHSRGDNMQPENYPAGRNETPDMFCSKQA